MHLRRRDALRGEVVEEHHRVTHRHGAGRPRDHGCLRRNGDIEQPQRLHQDAHVATGNCDHRCPRDDLRDLATLARQRLARLDDLRRRRRVHDPRDLVRVPVVDVAQRLHGRPPRALRNAVAGRPSHHREHGVPRGLEPDAVERPQLGVAGPVLDDGDAKVAVAGERLDGPAVEADVDPAIVQHPAQLRVLGLALLPPGVDHRHGPLAVQAAQRRLHGCREPLRPEQNRRHQSPSQLSRRVP